MILIDANLLLYAHDSTDRRHDAARTWLEAVLASQPDVRFALSTLMAFMRIATEPRIYANPRTAGEAVAIVRSLLALPNVAVASPGERHWPIMADLVERGKATGPLIADAHLAALSIEHGATLATTDPGFSRFPRLRWTDPLADR